jgi:hypothetical protein
MPFTLPPFGPQLPIFRPAEAQPDEEGGPPEEGESEPESRTAESRLSD